MTTTTFNDGVTLTVTQDPREYRRWVAAARGAGDYIAIDTETTGLSPQRDVVAVVALEHGGKICIYRALTDADWGRPLDGAALITQNGTTFDLVFPGAPNVGSHWDLRLAERLILMRNQPDVYDTDSALTKHRRGASLAVMIQRYIGGGAAKLSVEHAPDTWILWPPSKERLAYVVTDVVHMREIRLAQRRLLGGTNAAVALEMQTSRVVVDMMRAGVPVEPNALTQYRGALALAAVEPVQRLAAAGIESDRVGSVPYVTSVLEARGHVVNSTAKADLFRFGVTDNIAFDILAVRQFRRAMSSYRKDFDPIERNGAFSLHPTWQQLGTSTARFSAVKPAFHSLPKDARGLVAPREGMALVAADWEACEVYVAADIAGDEDMANAVRGTLDMHTGNCIYVDGLDVWEAMSAEAQYLRRRQFKSVTFTWLYGGRENGVVTSMARVYGGVISREGAGTVLRALDRRYPGYSGWARGQRARFSPRQRNIYVGADYYRPVGPTDKATIAINSPVQATAAIALKHAMVGIERAPVITMHDELVYHVPMREADDFAAHVHDVMVSAGRATGLLDTDLPANVAVLRDKWK